VPLATRDMSATWRTLGTLCREFGWSRQRLLYELQNGRVRYRTIPEGYVIDDWLDPYLRPYLNVEASEISIPSGVVVGAINDAVAVITGMPPPKRRSELEGMTIGIEVLPPGAPADADVPSPSAGAPAVSPAPPRKVSEADVERCLRAIMAERPDNPPGEDELFAEMTRRLGASPGRDRLRQLRRRIAPEWRRPKGHPRNFISAKKSAV
jgi:hypothetical protein